MLPELVLLNELGSTQPLCRIWPEESTVIQVSLHENKRYYFELRNPPDVYAAQIYIEGIRLKKDIPSPTIVQWEWQIGFNAGIVEFELHLEKFNKYPFSLEVDPELKKLTKTDFDQMIRDILDDTFALLSLSNFKKGLSKGNGKAFPQIAKLEFLKGRVEELEKVIKEINKNPQRILKSNFNKISINNAGFIEPRQFNKSLRSSPLIKATNGSGLTYMPTQIFIDEKRISEDLREHRDIKFALKKWSTWLMIMGETIEKLAKNRKDDQVSMNQVWSKKCKVLSRRLTRLVNLPIFTDVSDSYSPVLATQVYRKVPIYNKFLMIYNDFNKGISNVVGDFLNVPLARTFELYEIWSFLRITRAVSSLFPSAAFNTNELFGMSTEKEIVVSANNVIMEVTDKVFLCYQKTYKEFWVEDNGIGSYSRELRPDITLEFLDNANIIVLDAKYRIDNNINESLTSIHTYRDALVSEATGEYKSVVSGAYILTPHLPSNNIEKWKDVNMPGRLFHPEYRGTFKFGAASLRPGMDLGEIENLLKEILKDSAIAIFD
ncbi:hypothetical protein A8L34_25875 [Bacillus sp. FJAT-27264]|uniref:DUF2357 domain-containing protein n=1 Tax=Paenibacillus sp. (strain DSM 101736 / FJAT-27264) TaxID=1850362 RepID=UPI000807FD1D|nr:DUF2357 domain-containing protein [Bacillus sp. FJAT-27264]OBZ07564.1 hypothetical protein A8L34_25875 [Bacillus sp. FJAT-27264]